MKRELMTDDKTLLLLSLRVVFKWKRVVSVNGSGTTLNRVHLATQPQKGHEVITNIMLDERYAWLTHAQTEFKLT